MLLRAGMVLPSEDKVACRDCQHGEDAEGDVADHEDFRLVLKEIFVVLELVSLHRRQVFIIDHVAVPRQVNVVPLVQQDDHDEEHEVHWVDRIPAISHPECRNEQGRRRQVHGPSEDLVEAEMLVMVALSLLLPRDHRVHYDAEGDEEAVLSEEQDDEDALDVPVSELVDHQVHDDERLEAEQALCLAPSFTHVRPRVKVEAADHVNRLHRRHDHDPSLLEPIGERVIVLFIIKLMLFHKIWAAVFLTFLCPIICGQCILSVRHLSLW